MCPCAHCVDEITGEKIVKETDIPPDVKITESVPVGRYGVRFNFTDPSPGAVLESILSLSSENWAKTLLQTHLLMYNNSY